MLAQINSMVLLPQMKATIGNKPMRLSLWLQFANTANNDALFVEEDTKMAEKDVKVEPRRKNGFTPE